jgi:hypothetical protein
MKSITLAAAGVCLTFALQHSFAAVLHGPVTNAANGHVYYLLTQNNWTASEAEAVQLGGHLVTINDLDENLWVTETFGEFGDVSRGLWIGLNDANQEGSFTWISGETPAFEYWRPQHPLDPDGSWDYVQIESPSGIYFGGWRTAPDSISDIGLPMNGVVEVAPVAGPVLTIHTAVEITWPSQTNKLYQVQWTTGLNTNTWFDLGPEVPGNGSTNSIFDSIGTTPERFYRVVESPVATE